MKNSFLVSVFILQCVLAGMSTAPAFAETDRCLANPRCHRHIEQAAVLSQVGLSDLAIDEYRAAYKLKASPWILYNIARLCEKLNRSAEAAKYYKKYIHEAGNASPTQHGSALQYLARYDGWRKTHPGQPFPSTADPPDPMPTPAQSAGNASLTSLPLAQVPAPRPGLGRSSRLGLWLGIATLGTVFLGGVVGSIVLEVTAGPGRVSPATPPRGWVIVQPFQ